MHFIIETGREEHPIEVIEANSWGEATADPKTWRGTLGVLGAYRTREAAAEDINPEKLEILRKIRNIRDLVTKIVGVPTDSVVASIALHSTFPEIAEGSGYTFVLATRNRAEPLHYSLGHNLLELVSKAEAWAESLSEQAAAENSSAMQTT